MISAILIFIVFNLMILFHELGHFLVAKLVGMEVTEFAIGFGKKIISYKYKNTLYSLRLIPLGGFNEIKSLDDYKIKNNCISDFSKRIAVLSAGSIFNCISALMCFFILTMTFGLPNGTTNKVSAVMNNSPAYNYVQKNDEIINVNGFDFINDRENAVENIKESEYVDMTINRNNNVENISFNKKAGESLGINGTFAFKKVSTIESLEASLYQFEKFSLLIIDATKQLFTSDNVKITESLAGPIGVTTIMYQTNEAIGIFGLGLVFAIISINLGMFNLLPIPLFDGGHILIETLNFITKNKIKEYHIKYLNYCGYFIIAILFILGTYSDIRRLIFGMN